MEKNSPAESSLKLKLKNLSPLHSNCCVYRVPERLRQVNPKPYTPQVVSIGPLHHGKEGLQVMEEHKRRYLHDFLQRTSSRCSLEVYVALIEENEAKLRDCYAEAIEFTSDEFVEILLVDAAFLIEFLLRYSNEELRKDKKDHIFSKPYLIEDVWYDMWLLENQLLFFILEALFNLSEIKELHFKEAETTVVIEDETQEQRGEVEEQRSIMKELTYEYFKSLEVVKNNKCKIFSEPNKKIEHFTDFIRICHLPMNPNPSKSTKAVLKNAGITTATTHRAPSVIELHQAGVKFKLNTSTSELFDIKLKDGTLEIPKLKLQDETESSFRNLIAFEQRHYSENHINDCFYYPPSHQHSKGCGITSSE